MDLKHRSRGITDDATGRQPLLFQSIGFTDADLARPIIGVANT